MREELTVEECVKILTSGGIGFGQSKIEEAYLALLNYIKEIAAPLSVREERFLLNFGIAFSPAENAIVVNPIPLAFILKDNHHSTRIPYTDLLWYLVSHEKGHCELVQKGLKPLNPGDPYYMTLYARFQDYVITKFLKKQDERYIKIEKAVLKAEVKRINGDMGITFNDLAVLGLAIALNYVKIEDLVLTPKQIKGAEIISGKMKNFSSLKLGNKVLNVAKEPNIILAILRRKELVLENSTNNLKDDTFLPNILMNCITALLTS